MSLNQDFFFYVDENRVNTCAFKIYIQMFEQQCAALDKMFERGFVQVMWIVMMTIVMLWRSQTILTSTACSRKTGTESQRTQLPLHCVVITLNTLIFPKSSQQETEDSMEEAKNRDSDKEQHHAALEIVDDMDSDVEFQD